MVPSRSSIATLHDVTINLKIYEIMLANHGRATGRHGECTSRRRGYVLGGAAARCLGPTLLSAASAETESMIVENETYAFGMKGVQFWMIDLELPLRGPRA